MGYVPWSPAAESFLVSFSTLGVNLATVTRIPGNRREHR